MNNILNKVREFQIASEQPVSETPLITNQNYNMLRYRLMKEENTEYIVACQKNDLVEVLDACIDKLYVLAGTINQHGLQDLIEEAFNEVHRSNMTKCIDGKVLRNPDGKILKGEGYSPPNLKHILNLK
jgi:predicted HAD superfamily Cof-like phosphohydrolase